MLPETKDGRDLFNRIRENRSRWRQWNLGRNHGDMEALKREELSQLSLEADLPGFRESFEFMKSEGMLSPEQVEAGENLIGWGKAMLATIPEDAR